MEGVENRKVKKNNGKTAGKIYFFFVSVSTHASPAPMANEQKCVFELEHVLCTTKPHSTTTHWTGVFTSLFWMRWMERATTMRTTTSTTTEREEKNNITFNVCCKRRRWRHHEGNRDDDSSQMVKELKMTKLFCSNSNLPKYGKSRRQTTQAYTHDRVRIYVYFPRSTLVGTLQSFRAFFLDVRSSCFCVS